VNGTSARALDQGVVWNDSANSCLLHRSKSGWTRKTTRIEFTEVRFKGEPLPLWLPREVEVETRFSGVTFRNTHFYPEFKQFTVQTQERIAAPVTQ
jgi:hypothetical protein